MDDESLSPTPGEPADGSSHDPSSGVVAAAEALVEAAAVEVDLDATAADLDGVDAALRRLDDGTYGTCEVCSTDLAEEALAGDPTLRRCPAHVVARALPGTALPPAPGPAPPSA